MESPNLSRIEQMPVRLRAEQAARYLNVKSGTLAKWRVSGCGPVFIRAGRRILYEIADLDAWAEERKCASTSAVRV